MTLFCPFRLFHLVLLLFLFICVHGKYPLKVHAMVQEQLARRRYGSEVGQWSGWSSWSPCSRTCGGGIRTQSRLCLQNAPGANGTVSGEQPRQWRRRRPQQQQQQHGGRRRLRPIQCTGSDKRFHMCNEEGCPEKTADFRAEQCTSFNEKPYKSKLYRWRPHYSTKRPCSLTCRPENAAFYVTLSGRVADGTRCSPDGGRDRADHICAAGDCKHIGCDGVVGSPHVRDACGVCGGNNSTCQIISGLFTEPYLREGYRLVVQIPAGACSIHIEELQPTSNYLALRDINQEFILNGDWNIDNSGQYQGAGASFMYRRQSNTKGETITAVGPITQPVDIFILYRQTNRGIKYEYAIKRNDSLSSVLPRLPTGQGLAPAVPLLPALSGLPPRPTVHRNTVPSSGQMPNTAPPPLPPGGTGVPGSVPSIYHQRRPPHQPGRPPHQPGRPPHQPGRPPHQPGRPPHQPGRRRRPGTAGAPGAPGDPSGHSGPGVFGGRRRGQRTGRRGPQGRRRGRGQRIGQPRQVPEPGAVRPDLRPGTGQRPTRPAAGTGPHRRRRRRRRRSRFQWVVPRYSECTKSCGGGTRVPEVVCMRRKRKQLAPDSRCNPRRKPRTRPVVCNTAPCPVTGVAGWEANDWSPCSTSCGKGHQTRTFLCVRAGQPVEVTECVGRPAEPATQPCNSGPCQPALRWNVGQWSTCSVSCGWGTRTRSVTCTEPRSAGWCPETDRPRDTAPCRRKECPVPDPGAAPHEPAGWMVTVWTHQCSVSCSQGVQSRGVACGGGPDRCDASQRPSDTRPCKTDRGCSGIWFTGPWSQCSRDCGVGGQATRTVLCVRQAAGQFSVTSELSCSGSPRPPARQECGAEPGRRCAPRWFTADWAACSVTCGGGQQRRVVACVGTDGRLAAGCPAAERPAERRPCQQTDCPSTASASESSDASAPLVQPGTTAGKKPGKKSPLAPSLGPEYQTIEESENEIQVGSEDNQISDHGGRLSSDGSLWSHQLQAQTANQTVTARAAPPLPLPGGASSDPPATEPPDGDSAVAVDWSAPVGEQSDPAVTLGDPWSPETAGWLGKNGTALGPGQPADFAAVPTAAEAAVTVPPRAQEVGVGVSRGSGNAGQTDQGASGNAVSADDTDSCTDKVSHCAVVKRARLCQTSFYASSCCASCRLVR